MRAVIQRVTEARVSVRDEIVSSIGPGLCILLGIGVNDGEKDAEFLASKISSLRIFEDEQGKMNRAIRDINGELLVVSQFTLYGECRKGNRPSFTPPRLRNLQNTCMNTSSSGSVRQDWKWQWANFEHI